MFDRTVRFLVHASTVCTLFSVVCAAQQPNPTTARQAQPAGTPAAMPAMMGQGGDMSALSKKAAAQWAMLTEWVKWPDQEGSGPYPASYDMAPGGLEYVVYQPKDLGAATRSHKLGIYIWGNSGCVADGASARYHLTEIASHGFVVIAPGTILNGPKAPPAPPADAAAKGTPSPEDLQRMISKGASSAKMIAALDWILAENKREGSPYFGLINSEKVAIGGNSCGGLIAIKTASDPRVKVLAVQNSGVFSAPPAMPGNMSAEATRALANSPMMSVKKEDLAKLHTAVLYVEGGPDDVSQPNALDDFKRINQVPVFVADHPGAGHVGLFLEPNGEGTKIELDWLAWQLDGDRVAAQTFVGPDCVLCRDFRWAVYRKGIE